MPAKPRPRTPAAQPLRSSTSPQLASLVDPSVPTPASVIAALSEDRLLTLCRVFGCEIREVAPGKDHVVVRLARHLGDRLPAVLRELGRDELRTACRRHGLDASARAQSDLQAELLTAAGLDPKAATIRPPAPVAEGLPAKDQVVHARHRQWLVEEVIAPQGNESALVRLVCLDDDDPGRELDVLWDLELGARVVAPEAAGLGTTARLDPPSHFGAYLHALKWSAVSAADAARFQAPFRAGIKLMAHQLTPLMKALELPRANLFIADDVGLGKTIEAGLVLQELLLRQQANFVLVVCPASVCLQWQGEMQRRFGLRFAVMTRQFVAYRRQERGFGTNPWATHNRFIVSHALLRRPEYREPLLQHLGERARKSLLVLDEAHVAAPASATKYATDTDITRTIRDLAPRFDNRLFLSATPHNGHSNSFSALLELLDPIRFTRGVPVEGKKDLEPVMVRRLKRDLRQLGVEQFPRRVLVQLAIRGKDSRIEVETTRYDAETGQESAPSTTPLGTGELTELVLAGKLARYTALCAPVAGKGRLPFIHLQQRLLSSPEAFARTLMAHTEGLTQRGGKLRAVEQQSLRFRPRPAELNASEDADPEIHGLSDEVLSDQSDAEVRHASEALPSPTEEAHALLTELRSIAENARREPDAKALTLLAWIRENLCPAVGLEGDRTASRRWAPRRVILFTEYADTKRYLLDLLQAAVAHTDRGDQRILQFHGGMGDDARHEVQQAFQSGYDAHPVRILIATDAAREGVNLQAHCADLFHIDLPWNPSRLEQRNGRIDRTLQPADEVRCHYFVFPDRTEDLIMATVVRKVEIVKRELGSLGTVLLTQIESALADGITGKTLAVIEGVGKDAKTGTVDAEFEPRRRDLEAVRAEVERAGRRLESSRKTLEVYPDSLRGVVDVGLRLANAGPLVVAGETRDHRPTYTIPPLDRSWEATLDTLRPPRERDESFWDWRQRPLRPVTFHPLTQLDEEAEQLHLAHPFVRRILDRFLAQGFGAHDLSRVTAVVAPDESVIRVVAYARLSLFGQGAARLHDQLVPMAAAWSGEASHVTPYKDRGTARSAITDIEKLLATNPRAPNATIAARIHANAAALFRALWSHLEAEADALAVEARAGLGKRAEREAGELTTLLKRQREAITDADARLRTLSLFELQDKDQKRQVELDLTHLETRQKAIAGELVSEPAAIRDLYDVRMSRLTPVGLVVAYPELLT